MWFIDQRENEDDDRKREFVSSVSFLSLYRGSQRDRAVKAELNRIERSKKRVEKLFAIAGRDKLETQQLSSSMQAMKGKKQKT